MMTETIYDVTSHIKSDLFSIFLASYCNPKQQLTRVKAHYDVRFLYISVQRKTLPLFTTTWPSKLTMKNVKRLIPSEDFAMHVLDSFMHAVRAREANLKFRCFPGVWLYRRLFVILGDCG